LKVSDPAFQMVVDDVTRTVAPITTVHNLTSPYGRRDQVSRVTWKQR
jgi:hypothetical protein